MMMVETLVTSETSHEARRNPKPIYNDFSMVVATVNGSGSQTSNMAIIRALFRMGIPVSGKNIFPSNIQGLPTWFSIRANSEGFTARRDTAEILVAMNVVTFADDLESLASGGVCYYSDDFSISVDRDDVVYYPMPVRQLLKQINPPKKLRDYIANMVYVGVLAQMMDIELGEVERALEAHFQGKLRPVELNMSMINAAATWAQENLEKVDAYYVRREDKTKDQILIDGNTAGALGAVYGGLTFAAWYPITPASSLADSLKEFLPQLRCKGDSRQATYAIIQAEDELAAIGMAVGAGWSGARAMTSTSGPGISLMAEFAGLAYQAEIPVVIWDIQRMGPSTGLPTRTSQGDLLFVRFLGHGDTRHVVLLPGNMKECFEFGWRAFDLAERLQTPIFVLSDLDLGMNLWISDPFDYPGQPMDRGKILDEEDLERLGSFARYKDVDGDGIPYRTLPGTDHPLAAYFTRGTGHDEAATYSEKPEHWEVNTERLWRKNETAKEYLPPPVVDTMEGARIGLIAFGSTDPAVREARAKLVLEGVPTDYMRITALPFTGEIEAFIRQHERLYVIEMNHAGQMRQLLQLEVPGQAEKIQSIRKNDGLPLSAGWIVSAVLDMEGR
jgi:2-oxoglutarate ferredoxin oxidoreductase subunit alpha